MGDITNTAQTAFSNNLRLELNQTKSLLASRAMTRNQAGSEKEKIENLISHRKAKRKTGRHEQVQYNTAGWDGIWVAKDDPIYDAELVDTEDKLVTAVDIASGIQQTIAATIERGKDDQFLAGFFGDMITGKQGTTLNAFPAGNVVPVDVRSSGSGATGMNVKKLRRARRILAENFVNMQQPFYIALTAEQIENLSDEGNLAMASADFAASVKPRWSADGKHLLGAAGFEFIEIELGNPLLDNSDLTLDGSNHRKNPFWTADGMVMNYWEELYTSVKQLPQQHDNWQLYARTTCSASRTDQNRCGYILNDEE